MNLHRNKTRHIEPPEQGWKAHTIYLVRVSYNINNPIHEALLWVGFLDDNGQPAQYTQLMSNTYEGVYPLSSAHYLRVIKELHSVH